MLSKNQKEAFAALKARDRAMTVALINPLDTRAYALHEADLRLAQVHREADYPTRMLKDHDLQKTSEEDLEHLISPRKD